MGNAGICPAFTVFRLMKRPGGKVLSAFGFTQLIMLAAVSIALILAYNPWRWGNVRDDLMRSFPANDIIDGPTLERWIQHVINEESRRKPLLIDVRSEAEFAVSHMSGARRISPGASITEIGRIISLDASDADKRPPIVVYCAVGYASSEFVDRLKRMGVAQVQMLAGGIFRWANDSRPLVNLDGAAVSKVHPGKYPYSGLLNRACRAPVK